MLHVIVLLFVGRKIALSSRLYRIPALLMNVYPNPTSGSFKLTVRSPEDRNLRVRLYDMNGSLLQDKEIVSEETEIFIQDLSSTMYFLKVINNDKEIKVFKIVKK